MMGRRICTADFKRRVVVEAMRGDQTVQAIAARHGINPHQVSRWKTEAEETTQTTPKDAVEHTQGWPRVAKTHAGARPLPHTSDGHAGLGAPYAIGGAVGRAQMSRHRPEAAPDTDVQAQQRSGLRSSSGRNRARRPNASLPHTRCKRHPCPT